MLVGMNLPFKLSSVQTLLTILRDVDQYPCLYFNRKVLRESIRRYEKKWLPLVASFSAKQAVSLVPPLDVEWVWICHMLSPENYIKDSQPVFGGVKFKGECIDHGLLSKEQRRKGLLQAKEIWTQMFLGEEFDITEKLSSAPAEEDEGDEIARNQPDESRISYDIAKAASRQMNFHYQVCMMPHYKHDTGFLKSAMERYWNFLQLMKKNSDKEVTFVPTYDIDLMWRVHMLHPQSYIATSRKILKEKGKNEVIPYDDILSDRRTKGELTKKWKQTTKLWSEKYGSCMSMDGGMWRGEETKEERLMRSTILKSLEVADDTSSEAKVMIGSHIEQEFLCSIKAEEWKNIPWVHSTDMRAYADKNESSILSSFKESAMPYVRRLSALRVSQNKNGQKHEDNMFFGCVTSFPPTNLNIPKSNILPTVIEVFRNSGDKLSGLPVATAHCPRQGTIRNLGRKFVEEETAVLLIRIGGVDLGLLCGFWEHFSLPLRGVQINTQTSEKEGIDYSNSNRNGDPGHLCLSFIPFSQDGRRDYLTRTLNEKAVPGSYSFSDSSENERNISFNLATGIIEVSMTKDHALAYVLYLASAAMHVGLQPRYEYLYSKGEEKVPKASLYPLWGGSQQKYPSLIAGGAERRTDTNELEGVGQICKHGDYVDRLQYTADYWEEDGTVTIVDLFRLRYILANREGSSSRDNGILELATSFADLAGSIADIADC